MVILQRTIPFIYRPMHVDASLNFIRLLRVVITPLVKSESTGCQCRPLTSPTPTPIHWQLSVKAMNSAVNFFFLQFSSVGCHLPRSQQLIFHFQNSLMWIFFFRSSLVSAYEYLFLQFRAQKGASLVFSECDKSTELMYIFS